MNESASAEPDAVTESVSVSAEFVDLPMGRFTMGTDDPIGYSSDGEGPSRAVTVGSFSMSSTAITNAQFETFVAETGYRTTAEVEGNSFVFAGLLAADHPPTQGVASAPWWRLVDGAWWRHPEGPGTGITERTDHPVVHVSWFDAGAYCDWAKARLPTEAEWEYAARGGLEQRRYPWGDEREPDGEHRANVWQGSFPDDNTVDDGYYGTAPADVFAPNGWGLYNMVGNVWEWCRDWFDPTFHQSEQRVNPVGPTSGTQRVKRGGSFLCHESYCFRFRVSARSSNMADSSTSNLGFRVVR